MESIAGAVLADSKASLHALSQDEFALREAGWAPPPAQEYLNSSAGVLETHLVVAALNEALHETRAQTVAEAFAQIDRIVDLASTIARLDIAQVLRENAHRLPPPGPVATHAHLPAGAPIEVVVRQVRSLLGFCPIEQLEELAARTGHPDLGHRCRIAYDALQAFTRRNAHDRDHVAHTVGRAYAEGRFSLREVCAVLGYEPSDAIAFLEHHGFCRNLEAITLSDDARRERLEKIDRTRLDPAAAPVRRLTEREVIASQRIEGIDARPWVPRS